VTTGASGLGVRPGADATAEPSPKSGQKAHPFVRDCERQRVTPENENPRKVRFPQEIRAF